MKRTAASCLACSFAAVAILGSAAVASGAEWPRWMGPEGTGISTEAGLAASWPEAGPPKRWERKVGIGFASPVALDGKIYLFAQDGQKDVLHALDAETGNVLWAESYERGKDPAFPGTRATPTIDAGQIFTHGSNGDLVCRELATGNLVWRLNVLEATGAKPIEWGQASSPLVAGDLVYVQGGAGGGATAIAVERKDGKLAWKSQSTDLAGYAAPILIDVGGQRQLVIFGGKAVYGMDPKTGKTLWSEPWETGYDVNAATPLFRDSRLLVTSTRNVGAMMLSLTPAGAKKEWEKKTLASKFQPPILDGDSVYANNNGAIVCLSWPSGETRWSGRGREYNLGAGGSLVRLAPDKLIAMSERGRLSLLEATPAGVKLISQVQLFDYNQVWSTPLVYRGKLYAKGQDELVCLDVATPK